jgi:hypothetical protein
MMNSRPGTIYTHGKTGLETLQNLLGAELKWAYVSRLDDARMVKCESSLPERWPSGRAFGPEQEVRWQKVGDHYRVDVLSESASEPSSGEDWERTALDVDGFRERTILLWGELGEDPDSPEEWIEIRIPRPLHYPVDDLQRPAGPQIGRSLLRVVIHGHDYTVNGIPVITRWAVLEQDRRGTQHLRLEE